MDENEVSIDTLHEQIVLCQLAMTLLFLKAGGNTTYTFVRIGEGGLIIGTEALGSFRIRLEAIT